MATVVIGEKKLHDSIR